MHVKNQTGKNMGKNLLCCSHIVSLIQELPLQLPTDSVHSTLRRPCQDRFLVLAVLFLKFTATRSIYSNGIVLANGVEIETPPPQRGGSLFISFAISFPGTLEKKNNTHHKLNSMTSTLTFVASFSP